MSVQPTTKEIQTRVEAFKLDLGGSSAHEIVRRYITFGGCFILEDQRYFSLKQCVAAEFHVHPNEVLVVGSAKLGFSVAPDKRYRAFCDSSDIDIAVISRDAFDEIWESVFSYKCARGYWVHEKTFNDYLARGWIRPDLLPPARRFKRCERWWEFFRELTNSREYGAFKIRGGLYRNWKFLEAYQETAVQACKDEAILNENNSNK